MLVPPVDGAYTYMLLMRCNSAYGPTALRCERLHRSGLEQTIYPTGCNNRAY